MHDGHHTGDTDEFAGELVLARLRAMTPRERLALADELSQTVTALALAGIRLARPDATEPQVHHELVRRRYGLEIARQFEAANAAGG